MTQNIPLRCRCGKVRGSVIGLSADAGKRAICYCDDCQIYALHLGTSDLLDERGGTEAVMSAPAKVAISDGAAELRCLRLSPKGLYRWYAACCNTPIGNMVSGRVPVLIVPLAGLDLAALGKPADEALGPVAVRMQARFAKGGVPEGAHPKAPVRMLPTLLAHVARGLLQGHAQPSPFFDQHGQPRVTPQLIDKSEREAIRAKVLAAARA
jgi:hypothetical protein